MTTYPPAARDHWYADNFPGSRMNPDKGVIHTTEGTSLPDYQGGATAPNYTAVPDFRNHRLVWHAHYPDEMSARALRNLGGGVETNTDDAIQVELVGTCDPATAAKWHRQGATFIFWPDAPAWALEDLAEFVAWVHAKHGVPIVGPAGVWKGYPASAGNSSVRFTSAQWRAFRGWCGHQHVPENVHGDPGALDWATVRDLALEQSRDDEPDPVKREPLIIDMSMIRGAFEAYADHKPQPDGGPTRVYVRRLQRALNARYDMKLPVDGVVGFKTLSGWRIHERKVGTAHASVPDWIAVNKLASPRYKVKAVA
jgi:hypothetical protein